MVVSVPAIAYMLISSIALGLASVSIYMQWGLVGEAIDYNEMITGKRTEGSIYGTFNLTRRIGQTVGNSAAVLALAGSAIRPVLPPRPQRPDGHQGTGRVDPRYLHSGQLDRLPLCLEHHP